MSKKKILLLSDHALSTSGVGTQSRHLMNGLIAKGEWTVRQFGAAIKHENYDAVQVNPDFIIKPIDGFGTRELIRTTLATERPDVIFLFTDPRFFYWLFEMEDEIHQVCPIVWWHVWDNYPYPEFNAPFYEATDLINCHSHMTYEMVKEKFPEKTNFVPHALPSSVYFELPEDQVRMHKRNILGPAKEDHFVAFWMNRNARRKRPSDVLWAWRKMLDNLSEQGVSNPKASLVMHTDPKDMEGPNLYAVAEQLNIKDTVVFSPDRIGFEQINILHNISDCCINISYAEGFGLATLEAMQCGRPIIAAKTGGLTRQVVDHRDGSENGVALEIRNKTLVGSQHVPYIYEDFCDIDEAADALVKMYQMGHEKRRELGKKAKKYVESEFDYSKTVDMWHETLNKTIDDWKSKKQRRWTLKEIK
jgi:glycosyltransferase involved in cell wall biosynthesis